MALAAGHAMLASLAQWNQWNPKPQSGVTNRNVECSPDTGNSRADDGNAPRLVDDVSHVALAPARCPIG